MNNIKGELAVVDNLGKNQTMLPLVESMGWTGVQSKNIMRAKRVTP